ncbi:MAG: winged helix-turn-helix domain-containing protein, partial [Myxococcota bacterium]
ALLERLVTHPGRLFTRQELTAELWPDTLVTDSSLTQVIRRLRKALAPHDLVETVPRRGYRFRAEVTSLEPDDGPPASGLVGRAEELRRLREWAHGDASRPVLTLLGPGGVGKTSLARRVTGTFVDLSAASRAVDVVRTLRAALSIEDAGADPVGHIGWVLASRTAPVVILDNVEQVVVDLAPMLARWIVDAPGVRWLVTSRSVLGLPQEHVMTVRPLDREHAEALLLARGDLGPEDEGLSELVDAVDGLPLAIELIAPRTRILPPAELVARLHELLRRPSPVGAGRHSSLQSCFDASWTLLDERLRIGLVLLCAPVGPFTLDVARELLDADLDEVDVVQGLVDQAWLQVPSDKGRFVMLTTVRAYLEEVGEPAVLRRGHERHGRRWAVEGRRLRESMPEVQFRRLKEDLPEMVAACERAAVRGDGPIVVDTSLGIYGVMRRTSPLAMWVPVIELCLEYAEGADRSFALSRLAMAHWKRGDRAQGEALVAEALEVARNVRNPRAIAARRLDRARFRSDWDDIDGALQDIRFAIDTLEPLGPSHNLGFALASAGNALTSIGRGAEALTAYRRSIEIQRAAGSAMGQADALVGLANLLSGMGQSAEAVAAYEAAADLQLRNADRKGLAGTLASLASQRAMLGDLTTAIAECLEAIRMFGEQGNLLQEAFYLPNLAKMQALAGETGEARAILERAIALSRRIGRPVEEAFALGTLGAIEGRAGGLEDGVAMLDEALTILEERGQVYMTVPLLAERSRLWLERGELAASDRDVRLAAERARDGLDRYGLVHILCVQARLEAGRGAKETARATLAEAERLAHEGGWSASPDTALGLEEARAACGS